MVWLLQGLSKTGDILNNQSKVDLESEALEPRLAHSYQSLSQFL